VIIDPATVPASVSYRVLAGSVVPRPIAFVSTTSPSGVHNLAPFSFFNAVCGDPPVVLFCPVWRDPMKDTLANVRALREFVVNIVSERIVEQMNVCAAEFPSDVDEFAMSGLTPVASDVVRPPRVAESPVSMECRLLQIVEISAQPMGGNIVIGEVVRFHVDDRVIVSGDAGTFRIDAEKLRAVGRMSGYDYTRTRDRFSLVRP
jgi:flavin reductase (DIM6/NTAB) family NADH-FMN oxidoreductase RutF